MRKLAAEITVDEAIDEWMADDKEQQPEKSEHNSPLMTTYRCTSCYLHGKTKYHHTVENFGVSRPSDLFAKILAQGSWSRCIQCQKTAGVKVAEPTSEAVLSSYDESTATEQRIEVCRICSEKYPNHACQVNLHRCSACLKEVAARSGRTRQFVTTDAIRIEISCVTTARPKGSRRKMSTHTNATTAGKAWDADGSTPKI